MLGQRLEVLPNEDRCWMGKGAGSWAHGNGVCVLAWGVQESAANCMGQVGLVGISSLTFTFRIFRVKVDSKVMRYL